MLKTEDLHMDCPFCKAHTDAVSEAYGQKKKAHPGALSLCMECGEWAVFTDDMKLRKPNAEEYEEIGLSPELQVVRQGWVQVNEERHKEKPKEPPKPQTILDEKYQHFEERLSHLFGESPPPQIKLAIKYMFVRGAASVFEVMGKPGSDPIQSGYNTAQYKHEIALFIRQTVMDLTKDLINE